MDVSNTIDVVRDLRERVVAFFDAAKGLVDSTYLKGAPTDEAVADALEPIAESIDDLVEHIAAAGALSDADVKRLREAVEIVRAVVEDVRGVRSESDAGDVGRSLRDLRRGATYLVTLVLTRLARGD